MTILSTFCINDQFHENQKKKTNPLNRETFHHSVKLQCFAVAINQHINILLAKYEIFFS